MKGQIERPIKPFKCWWRWLYLGGVLDEGQVLALEHAEVVDGAAAVPQDQLVGPALLENTR